jgi:hypothetical protein
MKLILSLLGRASIQIACLLLSIFIYLNVVEKVALIDVPYINSVRSTNFPTMIYQISSRTQLSDTQKYGFFGQPVIMRIPLHNFSIGLAEEKRQNEEWIISNGVANFAVYEESQGGNMGNTVIFAAPESGLLAIADVLVEGDRIMLDTDNGWRYTYRVTKRLSVSSSEKYLVANTPMSQFVIIRDKDNGQATVVEAQFLNIEERSKL